MNDTELKLPATDGKCLKCGKDALDTGWECTECGYDNQPWYCPEKHAHSAGVGHASAKD